jgi:tricorn protease interacting factor F2/3
MKSETNCALGGDMKIERYDLHLDIDEREHTYRGSERIRLQATREKLTLNSVDLKIENLVVDGKSEPFSIDRSMEELSVGSVLNGAVTVEIDFSGKIGQALTGFYAAKFKGGEMFTTQFESSGARTAFPCVDHPAYKAIFSLSLTIAESLDAVSNMPVKDTWTRNGKKTVTFEDTPRMSTYLLYFGIGRFDERKESDRGKEIVLLAPKGNLTRSDFPLDLAKKSLLFFEDYFDMDYMLPKMHLISVPEFAAGAMENWGAVTMREVYMSIGDSTSARVKKLSAEVIAHEIAHHWFGNLVTMDWWNDLWLNESFATFMAYKVIHAFFPKWDPWGDFVILRMDGALKGDSLAGTHPVETEVTDPSSVAQIFDEISYGKGGCILRMIESYVGDIVFRDGIRNYLKTYAYQNAKGKDLWNSIEGVFKGSITDLMQAWITTEGYPVITVTRDGGKLHLEQTRFFLGGGESESLWPIPLTVRRTSRTDSVLFESKTLELDGEGFLKLNVDQTGFYRVHYDDATLGKILSNQEALSPLDRWGILSDLYAFLISGRIGMESYLNHLRSMLVDPNHLIVEELSGQLSRLNLLLPHHPGLEDFSTAYLRTHLERLGDRKEDETENESILRGVLARERSILDRAFAAHLSQSFSAFHESDPDLRAAIAMAEALAHNEISSLERRFSSSTNDEDRTKLISAMGWLHGGDNLTRALGLIRSGEIKKQDSIAFYVSASSNPRGREFMIENLEYAVREVQKVFTDTGTPSRMMETIIPLLGLGREDQLLAHVEKLRAPDIERGIRKGAEMLVIYSKFIRQAYAG